MSRATLDHVAVVFAEQSCFAAATSEPRFVFTMSFRTGRTWPCEESAVASPQPWRGISIFTKSQQQLRLFIRQERHTLKP